MPLGRVDDAHARSGGTDRPAPARRGGGAGAAALLLLGVLILAPGTSAADSSPPGDPVRIGILSHRGAEVVRRMWSPTIDYLSARVPGHRFELVPLDFDIYARAVRDGEVEFAYSSAALYVEMERRHGLSRIATVVNAGPNGEFTEYGGVLAALAERTDLRTLEDLRGSTLLIPDRRALGGWLMQWRELRLAGLEERRDYQVVAAGDNEKALLGVLRGDGDVAAVRSDIIERMAAEGKIDPTRLRVIRTPAAPPAYPYAVSTRLYPEWPFAKLRHTSDALASRVAVALLTMERDSAPVRAAEIVGWSVPRDYQPIHELFQELGIGAYAPADLTLLDVARDHWGWAVTGALFLAALLFAATVRAAIANRRLGEQKQRTETFLDVMSTLIVVLDREGRVVKLNRSACETLGRREAEVAGRSWIEVAIPPELRGKVGEVFHTMVQGTARSFEAYENEVLGAGGRRLIRWHNRAVPGADGRPESIVCAGEDITDRREAGDKIRLLARVFEASTEGVMISDAANRIVNVNAAFTAITGYGLEEVAGKDPGVLSSGRGDAELYRGMWEGLERDGRWQGELWNRRADGSIYPEWLSVSVMREEDGSVSHYIGVFHDISRQKEDQARIRPLAFFDPLTGLPNRTLLADRFQQAASSAQRRGGEMAVLFIDLDRFKQVNDSLGHLIGDELLRGVASRVRACLREADTLARLGGDEFIILLSEIGCSEDAAVVARKCIDALQPPFLLSGHELRVTPSIGIAVHPDDGASLDALVKCADTAMYAAKDSGRNNYQFFTADMNARIVARLEMENDLRRALERGEFRLDYQPRVDLASGRVLGVEALVRWDHPSRGLVVPGSFIPVAEESGLIVPLGSWVLREACRQGAAWIREGVAPVTIAVNVSAKQFRHDGFLDDVRGALEDTRLPASSLEVELTESLLVQDFQRTLAQLGELKALGVRLSVDDFGTGYSSMSYLKRFPVDNLKVDRSFVRDLTTDANDRAIAASIVALGHQLGLRVVAEGVESAEQLAILQGQTCDEYQGFLFSEPRSPQEVVRLLAPPPPAAIRAEPGEAPGSGAPQRREDAQDPDTETPERGGRAAGSAL